MNHLYHGVHLKLHVKGLAKKSTFEIDISRTKSRIAKILLPLSSTNQITYNYTLRQHPRPSHIGEKKIHGNVFGWQVYPV